VNRAAAAARVEEVRAAAVEARDAVEAGRVAVEVALPETIEIPATTIAAG
jgi:hypothetical protein